MEDGRCAAIKVKFCAADIGYNLDIMYSLRHCALLAYCYMLTCFMLYVLPTNLPLVCCSLLTRLSQYSEVNEKGRILFPTICILYIMLRSFGGANGLR